VLDGGVQATSIHCCSKHSTSAPRGARRRALFAPEYFRWGEWAGPQLATVGRRRGAVENLGVKMRALMLALASQQVAAFMLAPTSVLPATHRATALRMDQWDEEGSMVQGIAEGGVSFEQLSNAAGDAELPAEKAAQLVLPEPEWNVAKMAVSSTDEDFSIECSAMDTSEITIAVEPMFNTYEKYFFGLSADSSPNFKIVQETSSAIEGTMDRRGGAPCEVTVKFDSNGSQGEFIANLCFILEEEKGFSKFYEIKCNAK
jgi:hypothetical protein